MQRYQTGQAARGNLLESLQAVVLCGGLGTRLRASVPTLPKALAPVAGRPFLDYLLTGLATAGIRSVVLCAGYKGEMIEAEYGQNAECSLSIQYSVESAPLGTAGAVRLAASAISSNPFLLLNGDSLVEADYQRLIKTHVSSGAKATLTLVRVAQPERYGSVVLKANAEIDAFIEKCSLPESRANSAGHFINAGVYALDREILHEIPSAPPPVSLERDVLPKLLGRGLFGFVTEGFFIDIGVPEDYARAQTELPRRFGRASSHSC
jgi:NDP-sugar pyrophosphorylase family protein